MILKEVLTKAVAIICDDDIDLETDSKKRSKLISCANMVYTELVEEYVDLKHAELIKAEDGRIYYDAFEKPVKDILSVTRNGLKESFTLYPTYLACGCSGQLNVTYLYHAPELGLQDEVVMPPQYTANVLATGIASEFFFRSGLSEEAVFYKNRYDNSLVNLSRKKNPLTIRYRSFI